MAAAEHQNSAETLDRVAETLKPILSPRQSIDAIQASFAKLDTADQAFGLHWIKVIAVSNIELAYTFAVELGTAREKLNQKGLKIWLGESLTIYDREGLYPAVSALQGVDSFRQRFQKKRYQCALEEVKPKLDVFIRGLAGRALNLKPDSKTYTDTEHLYLPKTISHYQDKNKNKALYKSIACFLWAQTWYGTFKQKGINARTTQNRLDSYKNPTEAKRCFLSLENIRLLANIERELPGLYREMNALSPLLIPQDKTWRVISSRLKKPTASVEDTFSALDDLLRLRISLPMVDYQGSLNLSQVELVRAERKDKLVNEINDLLNNNTINQDQLSQAIEALSDSQTEAQEGETSEGGSGAAGLEYPESSELNDILESLAQDVDYLDIEDFGGLAYQAENHQTNDRQQPANADFEADAYYDEWDYLRQNYREAWCRLRIKSIEPIEDNFKQQTLEKYPHLMRQIRKVFEAMRDQPRLANRQTDGEDIDLDAVVDMHTALIAGKELSERMYIHRLRNERNVAVCLLVDMSGSTKGWINLAMRQSLILFSEALNTLGDQYAIFGFSGLTRQRCEIYTVKQFLEHNPKLVNNRISNIQAKDYTRMGFAIRYATDELKQVQSKHRILLLLSDGKPDDYDGYQGEYGIQDTRKAILEAQGHAIKPFSITIDKQAQKYLPRLFGPGQYTILNDISLLPLKISEIYRKLSS